MPEKWVFNRSIIFFCLEIVRVGSSPIPFSKLNGWFQFSNPFFEIVGAGVKTCENKIKIINFYWRNKKSFSWSDLIRKICHRQEIRRNLELIGLLHVLKQSNLKRLLSYGLKLLSYAEDPSSGLLNELSVIFRNALKARSSGHI